MTGIPFHENTLNAVFADALHQLPYFSGGSFAE